MNTNEIKKLILEESERNGIRLTEDELNAKILEVSKMDPEKLERLSGGKLFNCDANNLCWSDSQCIIYYVQET